MKLSELREAAYDVRLYKMPSDAAIQREARWEGSSFADLKLGYAALWKTRSSLHRQSEVIASETA